MSFYELLEGNLSAGSTFPFFGRARRNVEVISTKKMTMYAMRLLGIDSKNAGTSERVCPMGYSLQMIWAYACTVTTKMIKFASVWDWTNQPFICDACRTTIVPTDVGIAVALIECPRPEPTIVGFVNFGPEMSRIRSSLDRHSPNCSARRI